MILAKPWDGKDLKGYWQITYKIDLISKVKDGTISRKVAKECLDLLIEKRIKRLNDAGIPTSFIAKYRKEFDEVVSEKDNSEYL